MNYYQILNLKPNATKNEIKKSYHRLAIKYHPDKRNDISDSDRFKNISEAYSILSDDSKRKQYDSTGISDINLTNPLEMFQNIFNNFKPDSNFEVRMTGNCDISSMIFDNDNINDVLPDMFSTLTSVINGNEDNVNNPMKTNLVKTFINVTKNIIDKNIVNDNILNQNTINEKKNIEKNNSINIDLNSNKNVDDNLNSNKHLNKENIKSKDIFITKEFTLKEFYNNKKKKFNYYRLENNYKVKDSIIINLILNEKIIIKNKGHYLENYENYENYENRGDVIFLFTLKEEELDYKIDKNNLIIEKFIHPIDLYSNYKLDLILPNDDVINLTINDLYNTYMNYLIPNKGLLNKNNEKGNLIIKFNIIFNELTEENIQILNKIFPKNINEL